MKELYNLLDDCHTAIARSNLDREKYNDLSGRLVAQKHLLLKATNKPKLTSVYQILTAVVQAPVTSTELIEGVIRMVVKEYGIMASDNMDLEEIFMEFFNAEAPPPFYKFEQFAELNLEPLD